MKFRESKIGFSGISSAVSRERGTRGYMYPLPPWTKKEKKSKGSPLFFRLKKCRQLVLGLYTPMKKILSTALGISMSSWGLRPSIFALLTPNGGRGIYWRRFYLNRSRSWESCIDRSYLLMYKNFLVRIHYYITITANAALDFIRWMSIFVLFWTNKQMHKTKFDATSITSITSISGIRNCIGKKYFNIF